MDNTLVKQIIDLAIAEGDPELVKKALVLKLEYIEKIESKLEVSAESWQEFMKKPMPMRQDLSDEEFTALTTECTVRQLSQASISFFEDEMDRVLDQFNHDDITKGIFHLKCIVLTGVAKEFADMTKEEGL